MASRGTTLIGARRPLTSARAGADAVSDRCAPVTEGESGHIYLQSPQRVRSSAGSGGIFNQRCRTRIAPTPGSLCAAADLLVSVIACDGPYYRCAGL